MKTVIWFLDKYGDLKSYESHSERGVDFFYKLMRDGIIVGNQRWIPPHRIVEVEYS